jgi:peptidoglycan/LPS O-acetylase OafA/YrhL
MSTNSLNLVRLFLALVVVVGHSFGIGGFEGGLSAGPTFGGLGFFAVACFFTISGYLSSQSRSLGTVQSYLWKRILRILPGYFVAYILTSFLFSPIAGFFNGGWSVEAALGYLLEGMKFFVFGHQEIGSTLQGLAHPSSWNGSLWSVRVEAILYIATAVLFFIPRISQIKLFLWLGIVSTTSASVLFQLGILTDPTPVSILSTLCLFVPFYLAGSILFLGRESISLDSKTLSIALVLGLLALYLPGTGALAALPVGILILAIGSIRPNSALSHFNNNDYSYGVYVLSFPIQQTLAAIGVGQLGLSVFMFASIIVSLVFAALSWNLVESKLLKLKNLVK